MMEKCKRPKPGHHGRWRWGQIASWAWRETASWGTGGNDASIRNGFKVMVVYGEVVVIIMIIPKCFLWWPFQLDVSIFQLSYALCLLICTDCWYSFQIYGNIIQRAKKKIYVCRHNFHQSSRQIKTECGTGPMSLEDGKQDCLRQNQPLVSMPSTMSVHSLNLYRTVWTLKTSCSPLICRIFLWVPMIPVCIVPLQKGQTVVDAAALSALDRLLTLRGEKKLHSRLFLRGRYVCTTGCGKKVC